MRSIEHYTRLAVAAMRLEWGSEQQCDNLNELVRVARKDNLNLGTVLDDTSGPKASTYDIVCAVLCARVDADYANHPSRQRNKG